MHVVIVEGDILPSRYKKIADKIRDAIVMLSRDKAEVAAISTEHNGRTLCKSWIKFLQGRIQHIKKKRSNIRRVVPGSFVNRFIKNNNIGAGAHPPGENQESGDESDGSISDLVSVYSSSSEDSSSDWDSSDSDSSDSEDDDDRTARKSKKSSVRPAPVLTNNDHQQGFFG